MGQEGHGVRMLMVFDDDLQADRESEGESGHKAAEQERQAREEAHEGRF